MQLYDHGIHPPLHSEKTEKTPTPFIALPYDILWKTFSYLSQAEVLEAMAVCRAWYEHIPYHTTNLWRSVAVSAKEGGLNNRRKARCLGPHVHTVITSFYKGNATFLEDMEEIIERTNGSVQAAVLCFCSSFQSVGFYSGLGILGKHLTRLVITHHQGNNLDFFDIMHVCPHLTYFEMQRPGVIVTRNVPPPGTKFPKLTDLLIDGTPCTDFDFELILKSCPELCFLGFTQRKWSPGDIAKLTRHCDRLQSLYFVNTELSLAKLRRHEVVGQKQQPESSCGLRELTIQPVEQHDGVLSVSVLVERYFATLERLRLYCCFYGHLGADTSARSLTQLVLSDVKTQPRDLVCLFGHCPNLTDLTISQDLSTFTTDVIDTITTHLNRLERLDIDLIYIRMTRFRRMPGWASEGLLRLFSGIQRNEAMQLRELNMIGKHMPVDDRVLYSIACLDTVEKLGISSAFCTDAGLAAFVERLAQRRRGQPVSSTTVNNDRPLRILALYNVNAFFAPHVLSTLGDLDGLENICLTACIRVTGDGLRKLVSKAKNLASLRLFRCHIVDSVGWINDATSSVGYVHLDYSQSEVSDWGDDD